MLTIQAQAVLDILSERSERERNFLLGPSTGRTYQNVISKDDKQLMMVFRDLVERGLVHETKLNFRSRGTWTSAYRYRRTT